MVLKERVLYVWQCCLIFRLIKKINLMKNWLNSYCMQAFSEFQLKYVLVMLNNKFKYDIKSSVQKCDFFLYFFLIRRHALAIRLYWLCSLYTCIIKYLTYNMRLLVYTAIVSSDNFNAYLKAMEKKPYDF